MHVCVCAYVYLYIYALCAPSAALILQHFARQVSKNPSRALRMRFQSVELSMHLFMRAVALQSPNWAYFQSTHKTHTHVHTHVHAYVFFLHMCELEMGTFILSILLLCDPILLTFMAFTRSKKESKKNNMTFTLFWKLRKCRFLFINWIFYFISVSFKWFHSIQQALISNEIN